MLSPSIFHAVRTEAKDEGRMEGESRDDIGKEVKTAGGNRVDHQFCGREEM